MLTAVIKPMVSQDWRRLIEPLFSTPVLVVMFGFGGVICLLWLLLLVQLIMPYLPYIAVASLFIGLGLGTGLSGRGEK